MQPGRSASLTAFRWPGIQIPLPPSILRWPGQGLSHLTAWWSFRRLDLVVDDVLWTLVTVLESLALVAMLCFFVSFCGCTI
ncbi:hypothetical protein EUGRSUZ_B03969 [Eucalyptus grandis]|uniref:Uncharacterized protein n=2 Tax=Eucalyptus grandis TaxID=71139 RepID=A0A059DAV0_EUCGR|nr:hypothetical protein EUGRSUZ_B03969 [Eucalyptus grandis]